MRRVFTYFLDLLFPRKCIICQKILDDSYKHICTYCEKDLPFTKNGGVLKGNFFTSCVSPLYYEDKVRESLLRYKFHSCTSYAEYYGLLIAECVEEYIDTQLDIITWVPLSKKRLKKRGYDQAKLLAEIVSKQLNIPCAQLLFKERNTKPQSRTGSAEKRKSNISGVYSVIAPEMIEGKRILLIDDIVTTGSTFSECARTLGMAGAEKIYCAAAARKRED